MDKQMWNVIEYDNLTLLEVRNKIDEAFASTPEQQRAGLKINIQANSNSADEQFYKVVIEKRVV